MVNMIIDKNMEGVEATINTLQEQIDELKSRLRLARGTDDLTKAAAEAARNAAAVTPLPRPLTLEEQIEAHLRRQIMTTAQLSKALGVPADQVLASVKRVRSKVHNLGTPDLAKWTWRIGNDAPPAELRALVERLISFMPLEFREIVTATGARDGLVQGHLVELRKVKNVVDLGAGSSSKARWFLMPENARDARLPRRGKTE